MNIFLKYVYPCPVNIHCTILTAQTDISQTYRTFSPKYLFPHGTKSVKHNTVHNLCKECLTNTQTKFFYEHLTLNI